MNGLSDTERWIALGLLLVPLSVGLQLIWHAWTRKPGNDEETPPPRG